MPLEPVEPFEQLPPLSLRAWKSGQKRKIEFADKGRDIKTQYGVQVVYKVFVDDEKEANSLWIKPNGSFHIGISQHLPLEDKILEVKKEILKGDVNKGTRYTAKQL